jgi:hypothetical protein
VARATIKATIDTMITPITTIAGLRSMTPAYGWGRA